VARFGTAGCFDFFAAEALTGFLAAAFFAGLAAGFLTLAVAAFFVLGAAVILPGLWGFFEGDFFALVARTLLEPGERFLLALVPRLLIVSSGLNSEPAPLKSCAFASL
jgi:hypothetical protein